jgi:hypothetical protein
MNSLINKVANATFGHGWPVKNLAAKSPGEMVRLEPPLFCELGRGSRVRGASAQVFARVSLANHLSWSGAFGWIACFLQLVGYWRK